MEQLSYEVEAFPTNDSDVYYDLEISHLGYTVYAWHRLDFALGKSKAFLQSTQNGRVEQAFVFEGINFVELFEELDEFYPILKPNNFHKHRNNGLIIFDQCQHIVPFLLQKLEKLLAMFLTNILDKLLFLV